MDILMYLANLLVGPLLLALVLFLFSYFLFYPKVDIKITEQPSESPMVQRYGIFLKNPSNQNISNLEFSFKFDERYPIKRVRMKEVAYKSGLTLRLAEDFRIEAVDEPSNAAPVLANGFRGETDKFVSGAAVDIEVEIDKNYDGSRGDVFPVMLAPGLPPHSYFISYKYNPLGLLSSVFFSKKKDYDFAGRRTKEDNRRSYRQKIIMPDGNSFWVEFEWGTKRARTAAKKKIVK